jgi:glycosyltransferase involved in cell wall biosynthesis
VDGHFALFTAAALARRSVRARPLIVHFQGPWADESEASGTSGDRAVRAKRRLERAVYRRADALVVLSTAFKRILVEQYGVSPWRVEVIVPGVDTDRFTPGDRATAREALGLPGDAFVAVTTRRLVRRTGVDVLIDAWAKLDDRDRAVLLVTGAGPEAAALRDQAARAGLGDSVRFLGEVSEADLVLAYRAADVSVVPSRGLEGFGLVVLESMACGTPAIGTEAGGLGEAIALLDPGLVVASDDAGALAGQLGRAMADPGALPSPARCRTVAEEHTWDRVADAHEELYERVVHPGERSGPRVVYLDHTAQISGAEVSLARLLPAIGDVETHVILATDGPLAPLLTRSGCSTQVLPLGETSRGLSREAVSIRHPPVRSAIATTGYVVRLTRHLRRLEPDIVHTNSLKAALYGGVAGRLAGVPVVWQINDRVADDYLPRFAVRLMRAAGSWLPQHVIVNSEATAATLPVRRPVTVIPHPIPVSPPGPGPQPYRPRPGLRVGIVGRLSPWKGQDVFLRGFAAAFPDGGATAVIAGAALFGEDEIEPGLRALAAELGIAERVEMLGHRDDVPEVMAGLDILVHASVIPEPFGMVVGEGMALGLPVVAADAAGPSEIIDHGVNGLLYRMGDPAALAAVLRQLAEDEDLRRSLGEAGRVRSADFSPAVVAAAVRAVYDSVLSGRSARPRHPGRRGR